MALKVNPKYLQKAFRKACKPEIDAYVSELKGGK